jgi:hypothetical protein
MNLLNFACDDRKEWEMKGHKISVELQVESEQSWENKSKNGPIIED